ncbi:MAG: SufD family Fe-S cluster assembly protein, partial [Candidatus Peribacteria bacterium]|nr:SufD family Fe-S cluster assembly protein [Candidatus Peribacteria bacterium]
HGAKMHRVPLDQLFYMQSKGLSQAFALQSILRALVAQILGHFELSEPEKKQVWDFVGAEFYASSSSSSLAASSS